MSISIRRYRATGSIKNSIKKRIVSSKSFIPILFVISIMALACIHVWQRVYVIGLVSEVEDYRFENRKISDQLKKAKIDINSLSSLSRMKDLAEEKLGLHNSDFRNIYTLKIDYEDRPEQDFGDFVNSLKKLADNLPVINESNAETIELFEK